MLAPRPAEPPHTASGLDENMRERGGALTPPLDGRIAALAQRLHRSVTLESRARFFLINHGIAYRANVAPRPHPQRRYAPCADPFPPRAVHGRPV